MILDAYRGPPCRTVASAVPAVDKLATRQAAIGPVMNPALGLPAAGPPTADELNAVTNGFELGAPAGDGELRGLGN
jgi:hypothetical protein